MTSHLHCTVISLRKAASDLAGFFNFCPTLVLEIDVAQRRDGEFKTN